MKRNTELWFLLLLFAFLAAMGPGIAIYREFHPGPIRITIVDESGGPVYRQTPLTDEEKRELERLIPGLKFTPRAPETAK